MNPAAAAEPPVARGLFLCDTLIVDAQTNKVSLINLFDQLVVSGLPSPPRPFVAYAFLTDGAGEVTLTLVVESLDGVDQVYERQAVARFASKLAGVHVRFNVNTCSFDRAGSYQAVLYANREPVAQTRFTVVTRGE